MKNESKQENGEKKAIHSFLGNVDAIRKVKYAVQINTFHVALHGPIVSGYEILKAAEFEPVECYALYQKIRHGDFARVRLDEKVDLSQPGIERFEVRDAEIFHYEIDSEPETTNKKIMTANEILEAAGLRSEDYYLVEILSMGGQKSYKDHPNEHIEIKCPGPKFISVFRGATPVS